jgi:hypothetical protein
MVFGLKMKRSVHHYPPKKMLYFIVYLSGIYSAVIGSVLYLLRVPLQVAFVASAVF